MKKIVQQINSLLEQKTLLSSNMRVLCTLSGGQDSIMLFLLFLYLKKQWNFKIQLIYCQHFWQAKNFLSLWQIWKIAFVFQTPICFVLSEKKLGSENHARHWRKKSIERVALLQNCSEIGFGHTGTDKLETALWHLIRGASPNSLTSLTFKKTIPSGAPERFFSINEIQSKNFKDNILLSKKQSIVVDDSFQEKKLINKKSTNKKTIFLKSTILSIQPNQKFFKFNSTLYSSKKVNACQKKNLILQKNQSKRSLFQKNSFFKPSTNLIIRTIKKPHIAQRSFPVSKLKNHKSVSFWLHKDLASTDFLILRPLLYLHREDILALTNDFLIPVIPDKTNNFGKLARSKIRNQLIPSIRFLFNSNFDSLFIQFLTILELQEKDSKNALTKIVQRYLQFSKIERETVTSGKNQKLNLVNPSNLTTLTLKSKSKQINQIKTAYVLIIQKSFQKLPHSNQLRVLKTLFFQYNSTQLTYIQLEKLRFLILSSLY